MLQDRCLRLLFRDKEDTRNFLESPQIRREWTVPNQVILTPAGKMTN